MNEALAKATERQAEDKSLDKPQKAAAQRSLKKLTTKLDKMGVEETREIKALKESAAAADISRTATLGIVLTAIGLILTLLFGGALNTVGIILLVVGIVLLVLGLID
ncbi:MAG: hypothetical protein MUE41_01100 [Gemmatimonadaceae bacterium]|nr:hypothetical protein [Gemmatimonadaceae bacterium]